MVKVGRKISEKKTIRRTKKISKNASRQKIWDHRSQIPRLTTRWGGAWGEGPPPTNAIKLHRKSISTNPMPPWSSRFTLTAYWGWRLCTEKPEVVPIARHPPSWLKEQVSNEECACVWSSCCPSPFEVVLEYSVFDMTLAIVPAVAIFCRFLRSGWRDLKNFVIDAFAWVNQ